MPQVTVEAGICGFETRIRAQMQEERCHLEIESDCSSIRKLAEHLESVDPLQEISFRGQVPEILRQAADHCMHAACPVPVAIIKAVEVAAGLALPGEVRIQFESDDRD